MSIQGEGVHQGISMSFIRLQGCNMLPRCSYCDTPYAQDPNEGEELDVKEVIVEISKLLPYYKSWVCITGGEPLWQESTLEELVRELKSGGYRITIETNGSYKPPRWWTLIDSWNADIKCPSSGVCGVTEELWWRTRPQDQVKFVVSTEEDLQFAGAQIEKHKADNPVVLVSPVINLKEEGWNTEWLQRVVDFCKTMRVRYSLQWHKVIWGNKRGV